MVLVLDFGSYFFDCLDLGLWTCSFLGRGFLGVGLRNLDFAYRKFRLDFGSWFLTLAVWYWYWILDLIFLIVWTWVFGRVLF